MNSQTIVSSNILPSIALVPEINQVEKKSLIDLKIEALITQNFNEFCKKYPPNNLVQRTLKSCPRRFPQLVIQLPKERSFHNLDTIEIGNLLPTDGAQKFQVIGRFIVMNTVYLEEEKSVEINAFCAEGETTGMGINVDFDY
jgi:hypothetical protein